MEISWGCVQCSEAISAFGARSPPACRPRPAPAGHLESARERAEDRDRPFAEGYSGPRGGRDPRLGPPARCLSRGPPPPARESNPTVSLPLCDGSWHRLQQTMSRGTWLPLKIHPAIICNSPNTCSALCPPQAHQTPCSLCVRLPA